MNLLSPFVGSRWVYVGVLAVGLVTGATPAYLITASVKDNTIKDIKLEKANEDIARAAAVFQQYQGEVSRISDAANKFGGFETNLNSKFSGLSREFQNATKLHPLPAGCVAIDDDRLRLLEAARSLANAARTAGQQTSATMPGNPPVPGR